MTDRSSRRGARSPRALLADRRGAVLVFVALSLVVLVGSAGIALDAGNGYLARVRLSRAVDAGALAAARTLRQGEPQAKLEAEAVARANGIAEGLGPITTSVTFGVNDRGENTVVVSATRSLPTVFVRLLGIDEMIVSAMAEAAAPPLDVVLILDTSGSLAAANAWDDLQAAAIVFTQYLSSTVDKMGLVSFQLAAKNHLPLHHGFKTPMANSINNLVSIGDTNIGEGLRLARLELTSANARPSAAKVAVFFTDGRATAMRGTFGGQDRMAAVFTTGTDWRGYFNNPGSLPVDRSITANGCASTATCFTPAITGSTLRTMTATYGLEQANLLRAQGVLVYSIGLGNLSYGPGDIRNPDLDYLRKVANEGGVVNPSQPQGKMYFAPSPTQLQTVFREVANDLVVRLAK